MTPEVVAAVALASQRGIRWAELLREAHRHSVLPLLRQNLKLHFWSQVPAVVRESLDSASMRSQQRNLMLTAELVRILGLLKQADVPAIPFKGPILALAAYESTALRSFADLDILVQERDLSEASRILLENGYLPAFTLTPVQQRAYCREECALQFRHPERDAVIELHWRLTERYLAIHLPIQSFWENSVPLTLLGCPVLTFSPEDLFLYLCVHAAKHEWERLEWLSSVAAVVERNPNMRWPAIAERARRYGIDRLVKVTFLLNHELLQTPLPPEYQDAISDRQARAIAREAADALFTVRESVLRDRGNWYLFLLRSRERWSDKARIAIASSFRMPYPGAEPALHPRLAFLYYLLRPARLFGLLVSLTYRRWLTHPATIASVVAGPAPVRARPKIFEAKVLL